MLYRRGRRGLEVRAADEEARALGVEAGMPLAEARLRVPGLRACVDRPRERMRALRRLAERARRFSPWVALDGEDGLLVEVGASLALFGGAEALVRAARAEMEEAGWRVRAAIASRPRAASLWARFGPGGVLAEEEEEHLKALPLTALGLAPELEAELRRLGLRRLGDLAALPRSSLRRRFGGELAARLEALFGTEARDLPPPLPETAPLLLHHRLPEPTRALPVLERHLRLLLEELAGRLAARGEGALRCALRLETAGGRARTLLLELLRPVRDPAWLQRLLLLRLERERGGEEAEVEALALRVPRTAPLPPRQESFVEDGCGAREEEALARLLERLRSRLGAERVLRLEPCARFWPEEAVRMRPVDGGRGERLWFAPAPRPLRLLARPVELQAVAAVPDGPPRLLVIRGRRLRVVAAFGPERLLPPWWGETPARGRDYWRLRLEEGWELWVYREGFYGDGARPRWWCHGSFDGALPIAGRRAEERAAPSGVRKLEPPAAAVGAGEEEGTRRRWG